MSFLEQIAKAAQFAFPNKEEALAKNCCIRCGNNVDGRITTPAGAKEYKISGVCEICFDDLFAEED